MSIKIIFYLIKAFRPVHWIKNLSIFAALLFSPHLLSIKSFELLVNAFFAFCLATSATYIFNDIIDAPYDHAHPIKKHRPIASGKISIRLAAMTALILIGISTFIASFINNPIFSILLYIYLSLQFLYTIWLKNISVIDILTIASGFVLRVYAGAFVIDAHLSVWFMLCVISVALFLASGKRRAEIGIIQKANVTRKSLSNYSKPLLNSYVTMFGNAAWMSWALYTFYESPQVTNDIWVLLSEISRTTTISKLLMITIPVAIFGIMRYQSLIFQNKTEAPEKLLLTDKSLVISSLLWVGLVIIILYAGIAEH
ncbi:MAG: decaprenyl-phosphate phosphoribosyltransferase [Patescibacteria group bacterium]|nr:decaprenyl-phosphate phosphoribosyltransferase [Patescibacteria group bacterium]